MRLTRVQKGVIEDLRLGQVLLHSCTHSFPPYAEYQYCGLTWRVRWVTFMSLVKKGAIKNKHSNCWEPA